MSRETKQIALSRIEALFELAQQTIRENPTLAQKYVAAARKIAMATRVRLPAKYRRQVCRRCKRFILPNVNCRVRIRQRREPHVVITCMECGGHTRIPLRKRGASHR